MADDRNRLRTTFDEAASLYDEVRPGYPEDLFDDIISLSGIPARGRILEIGCGTGHGAFRPPRLPHPVHRARRKYGRARPRQPEMVSASRSAHRSLRGVFFAGRS